MLSMDRSTEPVDGTHHNLKGYILDEGCRAENFVAER